MGLIPSLLALGVYISYRIVILNKGSVAYCFAGADKRRLRVDDLLDRFEDLRRRELLDEAVTAWLRDACM
jgi:putative ABC transport system ATP-binding protein